MTSNKDGGDVHVAFDDLPLLGTTGLRHSWDIFGASDELGTLNRITDRVTLEALQVAKLGQRFSLDLPTNLPSPALFGRNVVEHTIYELDRNTWDDRLDGFQLQGTSQWDGLRHVRAREYGFYGGWQGPPNAESSHLGIDRWSDHGIVTRGVLVDLTQRDTLDPFVTHAFSAEAFSAEVARQCGPLRFGDVLCIRTGWTERYLALDQAKRTALIERDLLASTRQWAGLAASEDMARYLWDSGVAAVACDNPALEVAPGDSKVGDLHRRLLPCLGFAVGELFYFADLFAACQRENRREFLFASVPLKVPGGVGSPANVVAVL
jgi:kynurenine formamidase